MAMIACNACDAFNSPKASVCIECGERLHAGDAMRADPAASPPPLQRQGDADAAPPELPGRAPKVARKHVSRRQRDPEQVERSRQRQEFGRIKNIVFTVRSIYWSGVVFAITQLLLFHLILSPAFAELEMTTMRLVCGVVLWGQLVLLFAGARLVVKKPFVWTVVGAVYWLLSTAQAFWIASLGDWLLLQDTRFFAYLTMMSFMLIAFWFAVAQARRVQRLMDENPELQLQRRRLSAEERSYGGVAEEARTRRADERRRSHAAQLRLIGVALGVLLLGGGGVWAMTRPPAPEDAAAAFEAGWSEKDFDQVFALCEGGKAGRLADRMRESLEQRGWHESPPELSEVDVQQDGERAATVFVCEGGQLLLLWQLDESQWQVRSVTFPELDVGSAGAGVVQFREAWQTPGMDALRAMVRAEDSRVGTGIRNILDRRGWLEKRPPLGDVDIGSVRSRGRATSTFELEDVELRITLQYWHPGWKITGFSLR